MKEKGEGERGQGRNRGKGDERGVAKGGALWGRVKDERVV